MEINKIYCGSALDVLKDMPDESAQCCITSPPYYGLRDYGNEGQLGLEDTPEAYVSRLADVFDEVRRVLKKDGTLWLIIGDSYSGSWGNYGGQNRGKGSQRKIKSGSRAHQKSYDGTEDWRPPTTNPPGLKPKDLIGIPWMVAFELRRRGWWLRQDIIWHKPNPMPESVTDRCTTSHEYIFLLSKSAKYYYDNEAIKENTITNDNSTRDRDNNRLNNTPGRSRMGGLVHNDYEKRNKRSVWTVNTKPYPGAHFAVFPPKLIKDMILAGSPKNGIVLDPFMGAGTTAIVARKLNRNFIGIELSEKYVKQANERTDKELGMFK